jgi:hypothetical protein
MVALEVRKRRVQYPEAPRVCAAAQIRPGQLASGEKLRPMLADRPFDQLTALSGTLQPLLQGKITRAHLWRAMMAFLLYGHLHRATLKELRAPPPFPDSLHVAGLETACPTLRLHPSTPERPRHTSNRQPQCRPTSSTTTHAMGFRCRKGAQVSCTPSLIAPSLRLIRGVML